MYTIKRVLQDKQFEAFDIEFTMPTDATLPEMLEMYERFLMACGYGFKGHLEFIDEEEYINLSDE